MHFTQTFRLLLRKFIKPLFSIATDLKHFEMYIYMQQK